MPCPGVGSPGYHRGMAAHHVQALTGLAALDRTGVLRCEPGARPLMKTPRTGCVTVED